MLDLATMSYSILKLLEVGRDLAPAMAIRELPVRTLFTSDAPYGDPYLVKEMVERITPDKFIRERVLGQNISELLNL